MPQPTLADLRTHADAAEAKFGWDAAVAYSNITQTQFSIARHFGGLKVNGHHFIYNPIDDSLMRVDVLAWLKKEMKAKK